MIKKFGFAALFLIVFPQLSGCASILASMSEPGHIDEPKNTRTFGTYVEDQNIEVKIKANLYNADTRFQEANVAVFSYNRIALLVGQVPNQEMYDRAAQIAHKVRLVRNVHNELTIGAPLPISKQLTDSWISTKIKAHMMTTQDFPASKVQVITESGTVFLMGLLSESEADWAVDIVRQIDGVKKIIKIIEYTHS
ncbi:MAG: BON domain-containing protein [Pseudomonadales bacterium]|nr:BON domain-containing protein [Pseudomonadales bacterium]